MTSPHNEVVFTFASKGQSKFDMETKFENLGCPIKNAEIMEYKKNNIYTGTTAWFMYHSY